MLQRAVAGRRHVDAVGRGFGERDDVGDRFHRHRWRHHQDVRHQRYEGDRIEILVVVERQIRIERRVHRERRGIVQHGVAVGIGLRGHRLADGAAGAATVFDHELLAEHFAELGEDDARRGVGAARRRIRHHHAHRPVRPGGLRARCAHQRQRRYSRPAALRRVMIRSPPSIPPDFFRANNLAPRCGGGPALSSPQDSSHIRGDGEIPPKKPKKDPARPTRAKAARPDDKPTPDALANLLNPASDAARLAWVRTGKPGLQPPPDNSWDRRRDFSEAHKARKSTPKEFNEAPQRDYTASPMTGLDPKTGGRTLASFRTAQGDRNIVCRAPTCRRSPAASAASPASSPSNGCCARAVRNSPPVPWTPHRPPRPEKSEGGRTFVIASDFDPKGDQPQAIKELVEGVKRSDRTQVLLGVTGSGKTFTMAKVIEATQRPALILAPNKTLAAQLYGEFKSFFPDNAVEYFVSYYDYYQPEAYVPRTDTYIEKESSINEQIDRMRHSATRALLERDDVIIVASVSCIYGIGSVETYSAMTFTLKQGGKIDQRQLLADLVALQYKRTQGDFSAAHSACAATRSIFFRRTTRTAPGASICSATRSRRSRRWIRSPVRRPTSWNS